MPNSLVGQLAVNGNLSITAGQVYPTTGSTFSITSSAADGTISFARADGPTPATPYSAGGNLLVQAADIVQGGVIRVPLGSLNAGRQRSLHDLHQRRPDHLRAGHPDARRRLRQHHLGFRRRHDHSYGTTTDQIEWFFSATGADELTAPPKAVLTMGGSNVSIDSGATVDVSGGGDLYAYEFISGTGGSHDVLDRFNADQFSSSNGFQYPDGRQVYAIVPSLANAQAAAYDPIYSDEYADLYSPAPPASSLSERRAGSRGGLVHAAARPNTRPCPAACASSRTPARPRSRRARRPSSRMAAMWSRAITVPPARATMSPRSSPSRCRTQAVFTKYSNIALTSANLKFAQDAAHNGVDTPPLPIDAGRLILAPSDTLAINATLETTPGQGGRGAEVDISGAAFDIVSTPPVQSPQA